MSRHILVADPDTAFLSAIKNDPKASALPPILALNGKEAQLALAETGKSFAAVFVDMALENTNALSVVRFAHQRRPATPIFMLYDGKPLFGPDELKLLPVHAPVAKPVGYAELLKLAAPISAALNLGSVVADTTALGAETTAEDAQFFPIRAYDFISGAKSFFDVYVRLTSGRYVKILQAGDAFSQERVSGYLAKGVTHFYLRRDAQERYLAYCDALTGAILKNARASVGLKLSQTLNQGEETLKFLGSQGVSEANLTYASQFIGHTRELTKQLNLEKNDLLKGFLDDVACYEHGVSTAMIASILNKQLRYTSDRAVQIIGMAGLLHDLGLSKMSPEVQDEDEAHMTPEQIQIYRTHPATGAAILRGIHGVDPAAAQGVAQHHERRGKKGFPARGGASTINQIAEIVGISEEFARFVKRSQTNPAMNPRREMEVHVFDGFSKQVVEAFRGAFFHNI